MKTALVLSAGGMFGAYQAGAWKTLSLTFQPDIVVGASIGALNGWAIAGGCPPERLIDLWLHLEPLAAYRWRFPAGVRHGFLDSGPLESLIERLHAEFRPRVEYGAVATHTLGLRPVLFRGPDLSWRHLAASAAMLGCFTQQRIDGRTYSDGGLQCALPIWAAVEMGAQRVVAVNALPAVANRFIQTAVGTLRKLRPFHPQMPDSLQVIRITAPARLGSAKDVLCWNRENVRRWIDLGEADAAHAS